MSPYCKNSKLCMIICQQHKCVFCDSVQQFAFQTGSAAKRHKDQQVVCVTAYAHYEEQKKNGNILSYGK